MDEFWINLVGMALHPIYKKLQGMHTYKPLAISKNVPRYVLYEWVLSALSLKCLGPNERGAY